MFPQKFIALQIEERYDSNVGWFITYIMAKNKINMCFCSATFLFFIKLLQISAMKVFWYTLLSKGTQV